MDGYEVMKMEPNSNKQSDLFKDILDRISDALLFETFDHKIVYVNHYFCDLFHIPVSPEYLIGMDCSNAAQESKQYFKDPDQFVNRIAEIYVENENVKDEQLSFADGLMILRDYQHFNTGETKGHLWVYKNVSTLVSSLDAMTKQKDFFENLLNNIPVDIAIFNKEHQYEFVNRLGVKSTVMNKWLIGKDDFEYAAYKNIKGDLAINRRLAFNQAFETKKSVELEELNESPEKGATIILRKFYPVFENDHFVSMIGYGMDITRMRQSEVALRIAKDEAERANKAKSEFLSRMSHELRTPLNAILGFTQLLEMDKLSPSQSKGVQHIKKGGSHLLNLINEILDISKIEAGKVNISLEKIDLDHTILEMVDQMNPLITDANLSIELIPSTANQLYIMADLKYLKQVLYNLLSNAIKYNTSGGSIKIKQELKDTSDIKPSIAKISVIDTGIGISNENISKLFIPFERIEAQKNEIQGIGLGLSVTQKLIELMGGTLGVESKVGVGSTFWFEFPLEKV